MRNVVVNLKTMPHDIDRPVIVKTQGHSSPPNAEWRHCFVDSCTSWTQRCANAASM